MGRIRLTRNQFYTAVQRAIRGLPKPFHRYFDNIVVDVVDEPTAQDLDRFADADAVLFGMFEGVSRLDRSADLAPPSRVRLFRKNLEAESGSLDDLTCHIQETVVHEIGHYFGMTEEDLEPFEQAREKRRQRRLGEPPV